ncbi:hypothetical protein JX265_003817 [Neoarthrinium moseri]|uniref:Uncharacterized protein n=1 Tax=Neoarthrinium moseri TaxID=1658444 RepID=A0A9P9WSX1_9PEZI|nr:uncharacterized protein JN550_002560 [Neoarthrinium moseri]KAI1875131.1 hypothetical protein JN550_002560 [Neoarthrinium moseri]KAI1877809.1 hypothetical protein JX265_003817 [Neoarthrinium moseri]
MPPRNYPDERDDYDGQSILTISREGGFDRASIYPSTDEDPEVTFVPTPTGAADSLTEEDITAAGHGIYAMNIYTRKCSPEYVADYFPFKDVGHQRFDV